MLGIVVVLSVEGSNDGGHFRGHFIVPFLFYVLKQVVALVICSYYRTTNPTNPTNLSSFNNYSL